MKFLVCRIDAPEKNCDLPQSYMWNAKVQENFHLLRPLSLNGRVSPSTLSNRPIQESFQQCSFFVRILVNLLVSCSCLEPGYILVCGGWDHMEQSSDARQYIRSNRGTDVVTCNLDLRE
jgi:hypothetical protein